MKKRRKAIDCELVEASKTSPGYFKYKVTIEEIDGTIHVVPSYGKDMQDAIERLVWSERIEKVSDGKYFQTVLLIISLMVLIFTGFMGAVYDGHIWVLSTIIGFFIIGYVMYFINEYINKK